MSRPKVFEGIDWAAGTDRGYHVVTIGPDATREDVEAFRDAYELGCAWAEVEAALPEGAHPSLHPHWGEAPDSEPVPLLGYRASAWTGERWVNSEGPTPAAALRALAARIVAS